MNRAALFPIYCQQCLALVRRPTATTIAKSAVIVTAVPWTGLWIHPRTIFSMQHVPLVPFPGSQQIREAFLRAGPGRELGSAASRRYQSLQAMKALETEMQPKAELDPLSTDTIPATEKTPSKSTKAKPSPSSLAGYKEIVLLETDFRERFVKGGGNGGQKINKTNSNVELKHYETGIVVHCQATRSLPQNRKLARRILIERLDEYYNGDLSKRGQKAEKIREKKKRMARKSAKKYHGNTIDDNSSEEVDDGDVVHTEKIDPMSTIHLTTLEEILAGDNKKPSRRKSNRIN